jgi:Flp pilus assembly protein TadB
MNSKETWDARLLARTSRGSATAGADTTPLGVWLLIAAVFAVLAAVSALVGSNWHAWAVLAGVYAVGALVRWRRTHGRHTRPDS